MNIVFGVSPFTLPPTSLLIFFSLQMKLWNKYKVTSIPSLVFVDASTGKVVCRNGLLVVRDDPKGETGNILTTQVPLPLPQHTHIHTHVLWYGTSC